ncbi:helix-turn-helix domain-containing protein [Streptomyces sp. KM273126]|uniref:CdaR family transcriptional regulator n=1 Tax=Streptomyces sp. KM273126 TaxID=2545247 RepID=UPI0010403D24|nr:sugar diacid recognition domain-containing protein [Streptomyces sp. KM273126]MBA2811437.1 helix-turn-helix domain-containing protein [Streptomyces sp. KM273126]
MRRQDPPPSVLTPELAQEIACDIGRITGFNVLITDRSAVVIGCGDRERLGTVHEASYDVLRTRKSATHTARQAREFTGVRPGMSLPIIVGAQAVGTVCLTGEPDEVRRFGLVVRRQTEILLTEAQLLRSRMLHERAVDDHLRDIALYDPEAVDADTVEGRARELGLDPSVPRTAVLLDVPLGSGDAVTVSRMSLLRTVREVFPGGQDVAGELTAGRYLVLRAADGRRARLAARCEVLVELVGERHGLVARVALAEPGSGVAGMHASYQDAAATLRIGPLLEPGSRVFAAHDLRVPHMVASAVRHDRTRYADALLGELRSRPDWTDLRATLMAWPECGFHLVRTADRLQIHRNTLVHRLARLTELSGQDIRHPKTAMALYLACLADLLTPGAVSGMR